MFLRGRPSQVEFFRVAPAASAASASRPRAGGSCSRRFCKWSGRGQIQFRVRRRERRRAFPIRSQNGSRGTIIEAAFPGARAGSRIAKSGRGTPVSFESRRDIQKFTRRRSHGIAAEFPMRLPTTSGARVFSAQEKKILDVLGRVLAVAVQHERPGKSEFVRASPAGLESNAFAGIFRVGNYFRAGELCFFSRRVSRAVVHDDDFWKMFLDSGDDRADVRGFVEARNHRRALAFPIRLESGLQPVRRMQAEA
jgi:hypothetical protein